MEQLRDQSSAVRRQLIIKEGLCSSLLLVSISHLITFIGLAVADAWMQPMQNSNLKKHIIFSHQTLQRLSPNGRSTLDCQTNIMNIWWGKTVQACLLVKTDPMYVVQWHKNQADIVSVKYCTGDMLTDTKKKKKTYIYYEWWRQASRKFITMKN